MIKAKTIAGVHTDSLRATKAKSLYLICQKIAGIQ